MSELPPPQLPPPAPVPSSVIIDTNATVKVRRWPLYAGMAVAAAFAAYFVVSLTVGSSESYEPGPAATELLDALERQDLEASLNDEQLRCVDDAAVGIDPEQLAGAALDPLSGESDDPALAAFGGTVMDDCLTKANRVEILSLQLVGGALTEEQAACLSGEVDDVVTDAGGYTAMLEGDPTVQGAVSGALMGALEACEVSMADLMATGG